MRRLKWIAVMCLVILTGTTMPADTTYTAIDLGTLEGGAYSFAHAMNDSSVVVGRSYTDGGPPQPFTWQNGVMTRLGVLPGKDWGEANDINSSGVIVGVSRSTSGPNSATMWIDGIATELPAPPDRGAIAYGINEAGDVVGQADFLPFPRAALWRGGALINLGALPGGFFSEARAINNVGQIVGQSDSDMNTNNGRPHAVLWQNGTIIDLTPTAYSASALAINDAGLVVGWLQPSSGEQVNRAFYWQNGVLTVIDPGVCPACGSGSTAFDVNQAGAIALEAGTLTSTPTAHVLSSGVLSTLPGARARATTLNNIGQVAGNFLDGHAILWNPASADIDGLIAMILAANARPGPDTITLTPGATYTLTAAYDGTNGLPPITDTLTIVGNGATITRSTAPGTPTFRILTINLPAQSSVATLSNLTISNGSGAGDFQGGGIRVASGTLNLDDARVLGNSAAFGGGLYATSNTRLNLTRTVVSGNTSDDPVQGGAGGGIYNYQGVVTLTDSTVSANMARSSGGIFNYRGPLTITGSLISGNATSPTGTGGGLTAYESPVTIATSTISGNTAQHGGGIYNFGTLSIDESTISGNTAALKGGGIFGQTGGTLHVTNSTVSGNTAHSASAPTSGYGGGIFNWTGSTATIANSTIAGNFTNFGGGGLYNNGSMTVTNVTVATNSSTQYGSGLLNDSGGTVTIGNTILAANYLLRNCSLFGANVISAGHNLSDGGSCATVFTQVGDANNLSAGLDAGGLANNGGPTRTIALAPGSPAINTGDDALCNAAPVGGRDQRGVRRPDGPRCDKGAFEAPSPDAAPPLVTCAGPDGLWHRVDVALACTASDPSGLQSPGDAAFLLVTSVPTGVETPDAPTGSRTVCDTLGNCTIAGPIGGNRIDKREPSITIASPSAGAYLLDQVALASYACADGGSGIGECQGPVANGAALDTSTTGTHAFEVVAIDQVGLMSTQTVTYTVIDPAPGATATWIRVAGIGPSARAGHRMVYDSTRQKVMLFGGQTSEGCCGGEQDLTGELLNDMWEWDAATSAWTRIEPAGGPVPSPRSFFGLAYDPVRDRVVLFGGKVGSVYYSTDSATWEWDPATRTWTHFPAANRLDSGGRRDAQMAFDPNLGQVVLFGGQVYWGEYGGGPYRWDGTTWIQLNVPGPSTREGHVMTSDLARSKVVLYGGNGASGPVNDTWEWNGVAWTQVAAGGLPQRSYGAAAYDPQRGVSVLFGGNISNTLFADTWEWAGANWTSRSVVTSPPARESAMAFDGQHMMLFGGRGAAGPTGDTWILVPAAIMPQSITFTSTPPSPAFVGGTYTISATGGGSGNPVTFVSLTPATCTMAGGLSSFLAPGTCTIAADQAGNGGYDPAPQVAQTFEIDVPAGAATYTYVGQPLENCAGAYAGCGPETRVSGSMTLPQRLAPNLLNEIVTPMAFRFTDGRTVTLGSSDPLAARYFQVSTDAAGAIVRWTINIATASTNGCPTDNVLIGTYYVPFSNLSGDFSCYLVNQNQPTQSWGGAQNHDKPGSWTGPPTLPQGISFTSTPPSPALVGGSYLVSATGGGSGNPVTFVSLTPATCTMAGNLVALAAVGTCTVAADQAGGNGYDPAPQTTQSFAVTSMPTLSVPADVTREATGPNGAVVVYVATATDPGDPAPVVSCSPASGSTFVLGASTVTCSATNSFGNVATASFSVVVQDTFAPVIQALQAPHVDLILTNPSETVSVRVTDAVGVSNVTANNVLLTRTSGTPTDGVWEGVVSVTPFATLTINVGASDISQNPAARSFVVDTDGIAAIIDRLRSNPAVLQSHVYSWDFNDGVTSGTVSSGPIVSVQPLIGTPWIRLARTPYNPTTNPNARVSVCGGAVKHVYLDAGEIADVRCVAGTNTLFVRAVQAYSTIAVYKIVGNNYRLVASVPGGQSASTGSPVTADPDNTEPIQVEIVRVDAAGAEQVIGSYQLDPGEIADVEVAPGATAADDRIVFSVLAGEVTATFGADTVTVGEGETVTPRVEQLAQAITFDPIPNRLFGDPAFALTATATSSLPVNYSVAGACTLAGTMVTPTGTGSCTVTASQPGDLDYLAAAPVSRTFQVWHAWSGLLQPVNPSGSSVFKLGSTVPLKFQLTGGSAGIVNLAARVSVAKVSNSVVGTELEAASTGSADTGNVFRYDAASGQYHFNWSTKNLSEGTWQIRVDLLDGNGERTVLVSVKR